MKRYAHTGFIVTLFFATTLLIAAFILLFSYTGWRNEKTAILWKEQV